jgi:hypothetical protein
MRTPFYRETIKYIISCRYAQTPPPPADGDGTIQDDS